MRHGSAQDRPGMWVAIALIVPPVDGRPGEPAEGHQPSGPGTLVGLK